MGCLSIAALPPVLCSPLRIYTLGGEERGTESEGARLRTQKCPQAGLEPGQLGPKTKVPRHFRARKARHSWHKAKTPYVVLWLRRTIKAFKL